MSSGAELVNSAARSAVEIAGHDCQCVVLCCQIVQPCGQSANLRQLDIPCINSSLKMNCNQSSETMQNGHALEDCRHESPRLGLKSTWMLPSTSFGKLFNALPSAGSSTTIKATLSRKSYSEKCIVCSASCLNFFEFL